MHRRGDNPPLTNSKQIHRLFDKILDSKALTFFEEKWTAADLFDTLQMMTTGPHLC
jgi:hypothetical protein